MTKRLVDLEGASDYRQSPEGRSPRLMVPGCSSLVQAQ